MRLSALPIFILFQERFGVPYSIHHNTKAVLEPVNDQSSKGYGFQSVRMAPVYLGHEHGLVGGDGGQGICFGPGRSSGDSGRGVCFCAGRGGGNGGQAISSPGVCFGRMST